MKFSAMLGHDTDPDSGRVFTHGHNLHEIRNNVVVAGGGGAEVTCDI